MSSLRRTDGWYEGRPVAAGSTPSKLISARSSASTNTSITRTGLLSSMKSSRHSGNSVHCPRSASSTKRRINSPAESQENHNSGGAFSHSQGHSRQFWHVRSREPIDLAGSADECCGATTDLSASTRLVRFVPKPGYGPSFDHLVGAREQRGRDCQAERLRGLEVDHKIKLGRLFDRQIGGLRAP